MLELNELAMSVQGLEDSVNKSNSHIHKKPFPNNFNPSQSINQSQSSNSRQLFRKCKQIIQQQMIQIQKISNQNQSLNEEIAHLQSQKSKSTQQITTLRQQITELTHINQTLHKEMHKLTSKIQQLTQHVTEQQNMLKLSQNKNEALEGVVKKSKEENDMYKQKCQLMEATIDLMKVENNRLGDAMKMKEYELKEELEKLKRFKQSLERRNMINEEEIKNKMAIETFYQRQNQREDYYFNNPFNTVVLNRYPTLQNPHYTLNKQSKNLSDSKTADKTTQKVTMNRSMHHISPFSIVDQKPSISRIRKNFSKPKPHDNKASHFTTLTPIPQRSQKNHNPQIHSELSSIKKQLMKQYNMVEVKKEMMNQEMVGKTLKEIEKKLERMTKLTKYDLSQSQLE